MEALAFCNNGLDEAVETSLTYETGQRKCEELKLQAYSDKLL